MFTLLACKERIENEEVPSELLDVYKIQCKAEIDSARTKAIASKKWKESQSASVLAREKMIEAQKLLAEAKRLQKVADLKEDQAEEAQEKARAADFIRVKAEITLANIVKQSLFWSKAPLRNDLSKSVRDMLLNNDEDEDSSDDEAVVMMFPSSPSTESGGSIPSPLPSPSSGSPFFRRSSGTHPSSGRKFKPGSPPQKRFSHVAMAAKRRHSKRLARCSSREMVRMSSRNLMAESRRGLLTRESSRRVLANRLINPASKRRLLSVTSRDNFSSIKSNISAESTESTTLHRFIPQNAPLSMFPEDMSILDQYTFRDGTLGEGYYHSSYVDPPKSSSPLPPESGDVKEEEKMEEPTPKRRWNRAISLLGTINKINICEPKYGKTNENGEVVRTDSKKKHLKSVFPAEDIDLIEDCLRTALGDSRQATRILNVRRQTEVNTFTAITLDGEENFVKLMNEEKVTRILAEFLKESERKEFTFDPWKCGHPGLTLENDDKTVVATGHGNKGVARSVLSTHSFSSGRHYWEFVVEHCATGEKSCGTLYFGIAQEGLDLQRPLCREKCVGWYDDTFTDFEKLLIEPIEIERGTSTGDKNHMGIYLDLDIGEMRLYVDKVEVGRGELRKTSSGNYGTFTPAVSLYADGTYKGSKIRLETQAQPPSGLLL